MVNMGIQLIGFQDANFLSVNHHALRMLIPCEISSLKCYIETRPETINPTSVQLLKALNVDGVGMGVEVSADLFRDQLNRHCTTSKIKQAFHYSVRLELSALLTILLVTRPD